MNRHASSAAPLIIVGASARAAAMSACRAGYAPWCVDLFADRDLRAIAHVVPCPREAYPQGMIELLRSAPRGAPVLLTGAMENHLDVVRQIESRHPLLTCGSSAMAQLRRPDWLSHLPPIPGMAFPHASPRAQGVDPAERYLVKPIRSAGGHGIRPWAGEPLQPSEFLQQRINAKRSLSAIYRADNRGVALLGVTEQRLGGGRGAAFRYTASVGPLPGPHTALARLGEVLGRHVPLRGVFGIDLVQDAVGTLWPVEINPRYTAGCEVIERAWNASVLDPAFIPNPDTPPARLWGKQIVWARAACIPGDLLAQFGQNAIADVPDAQEVIAAGQPICTVLATGSTPADVHIALDRRAAAVEAAMQPGLARASR